LFAGAGLRKELSQWPASIARLHVVQGLADGLRVGLNHRFGDQGSRAQQMSRRTSMGDVPAEGSDGRIAYQPRNTVEIGIVTGEVGETMGLHDRDDQGIAIEELERLARQRRSFQERSRDGNHLDVQLGQSRRKLPWN
jgi:hypothetical protein